MTNACDPVDSGAAWARNIYSAHHNPALYFTNLQGGRVDEAMAPALPCRANDLPTGTTAPDDTSAFDSDLQTGAVGDFNVIVPNDCENGADPCGRHDRIRQFDDFLAREVPKIEASPSFGTNGTILITWDEGADPPRTRVTCCSRHSGPQCGRVTSIVLGTTITGLSAPSRKASVFRRSRTRATRRP